MSGKTVHADEDRHIRMTLKNFLWTLGVTAVCVTAWVTLRRDVVSQGEQIRAIAETVSADHEQLRVQGNAIQQQGFILEQHGKLLERMDQKLDYVTGATRTRPPAGSPPSQ
jgi:hypothetical protein